MIATKLLLTQIKSEGSIQIFRIMNVNFYLKSDSSKTFQLQFSSCLNQKVIERPKIIFSCQIERKKVVGLNRVHIFKFSNKLH